MARKSKLIRFKEGDTVKTFVLHSTLRRLKVIGTVKETKNQFGKKSYTITNGVVEDFPTRTMKKVKDY